MTFVTVECADTQSVGANQTTGFVGEAVAHTLRADGFDASEDRTGRGTPPVPFRKSRRAQSVDDHETWVSDEVSNTLNTFDNGDVRATEVVAFAMRGRAEGNVPEVSGDVSPAIRGASGGSTHTHIATPLAVRRLTPRECERLQGFPDDWTLVDGMADSPRYRALGNAVAVPVVERIGRKIVEALS